MFKMILPYKAFIAEKLQQFPDEIALVEHGYPVKGELPYPPFVTKRPWSRPASCGPSRSLRKAFGESASGTTLCLNFDHIERWCDNFGEGLLVNLN